MRSILLYLLQVVVSSGLLYGYYHLFLRNKRFHQYNRYYLLIATCVSILVPFLNIPVYFTSREYDTVWAQALSGISVSGTLAGEAEHRSFLSFFTWQHCVVIFYALILVLLLIRLAVALARIRSLLHRYPMEKLEDIYFVNTNEKGTPFSFFRWMFWNKKVTLQSEKGQQMFRHELFHIRQKHSWDTIALELLTILFWMNPFFYFIRRELKVIHEFLADRFAIRENEHWNYAELLLAHLLDTPHLQLTHPFFHNQIKRRIAMITTSQKPKYQYFRKVLVLPLMAIIAALFAFSYRQKQEQALPGADIPLSPVTDTVPRISEIRVEGKPIQLKLSPERSLTLSPVADTARRQEVIVQGYRLTGKELQPLYVVDGKIIERVNAVDPLKEINPAYIESITVLKGTDALNTFGEKGSGGVIKITTKTPHDAVEQLVAPDEAEKLVANTNKEKNLEEIVVIGYRSNGTAPQFRGGQDEWRRFLHRNLNSLVPVQLGAPVGKYSVAVLIYIDENGTVTDVKPLTKLGYGMEEEVVRAIKSGPSWQPATSNGKAVRGVTKQPVTFVVEDDADPADTKEIVTVIGRQSAIDIAEAAKLSPVYPNPATNTVTIPFGSASEGGAKLRIYNSNGVHQKTVKTNLMKGANSLTIDVSSFPAGIYFISVAAPDNSSRIYKLMKK